MIDRPTRCRRSPATGRPLLIGYDRCKSTDVMFISSLNKFVYHKCCELCGLDFTLFYGRQAKEAEWVEIETEEVQISAKAG